MESQVYIVIALFPFSIWVVAWHCVPLVRISNPDKRRDLAATTLDPVEHLKGELFIPAFAGAAPSLLLAAYVVIATLSEPIPSAPLPGAPIPPPSFELAIPHVMTLVVQFCASWTVLLGGVRRAFRRQVPLNAWAWGFFAWVVSLGAGLAWLVIVGAMVWPSKSNEYARLNWPTLLACVVIGFASYRALIGEWKGLTREYLDVDPTDST